MKPEEIEKLSKLSRIELSPEEKASFSKDFEGILNYVAQIKEVVTDMPIPESGELRNVMRDDTLYETLATPQELLNEAPDREDNYIKVKKVL